MATKIEKLEIRNWKVEKAHAATDFRFSNFDFPTSSFQFLVSSFCFPVQPSQSLLYEKTTDSVKPAGGGRRSEEL
jgi:hypothetical protein